MSSYTFFRIEVKNDLDEWEHVKILKRYVPYTYKDSFFELKNIWHRICSYKINKYMYKELGPKKYTLLDHLKYIFVNPHKMKKPMVFFINGLEYLYDQELVESSITRCAEENPFYFGHNGIPDDVSYDIRKMVEDDMSDGYDYQQYYFYMNELETRLDSMFDKNISMQAENTVTCTLSSIAKSLNVDTDIEDDEMYSKECITDEWYTYLNVHNIYTSILKYVELCGHNQYKLDKIRVVFYID